MGRTHLRALEYSETVRVSAIAEPSSHSRAEVGDVEAAVYESVSDMLDEVRVDGVLVAVPSGQHEDVVALVAQRGLPVLCEKPCGLDAGQTRRIAIVAQTHEVPLQVGYWRRYVPALIRLREEIQDGALGEIYAVDCRQWDEAPPSPAFRVSSGGIFVDMGVHELDQARWLTGQDFVRALAVASSVEIDPSAAPDIDSALALLPMTGGAVCSVSLGRVHPAGDGVWVDVYGTLGHRTCEVLTPEYGEADQLDALRRQAEGFADWVRGGPSTGATIGDAIAALEAAELAGAALG